MSVRAPWYLIALVPEGGKATPIDLTSRVKTCNFDDNERKTDKLKLTVDNFDLSNFDDPLWRTGALLQFTFGNGVSTSPTREVVVRKVTGGRVLQVEANDRAVELDTVKKRRAFEHMTRSEVVRQIADEAGFKDADIQDTDESFEVLNQGNLTDAQYMRKLAHLEGFQFFVDFDGLHWHRRRVGQAPIRTLTYYAANPGASGDILDFNVENDITRKPGRVRVAARDPLEQKDIVSEADNEADSSRDVLQEFIGVIDPESGELTQQARTATEHTVASNVQTQADADVAAKARYRLATQRAVKMTLKIRGAPDLLAKSVIAVDGLGARLSGKYYVRSVSHPLSGSSAYVSTLKVITDGFQRGYGASSGGDKNPDALLQGCIIELKEARAELVGSTTLETQVAGQLDRLRTAVEGVSGLSGSARAQKAGSVAGTAARVAQAARGTLPGASAAAANCAGVLRRIIAIEDARAGGNVNDQETTDQGQKQKVVSIDPETGEEVTVYVDKRGRDA